MKPLLRQVSRNSPRMGVARRQVTTINKQALKTNLADAVSAATAGDIQSSNIRVVVRIRPMNEKEALNQSNAK